MVVSPARWALMTELRDAPEPPLDAMLARLDPCDLVLIEGYKSAPHPKVETYRAEAGRDLLATRNPTIRAIAADCAVDTALPRFDLDDVPAIGRPYPRRARAMSLEPPKLAQTIVSPCRRAWIGCRWMRRSAACVLRCTRL